MHSTIQYSYAYQVQYSYILPVPYEGWFIEKQYSSLMILDVY